MITQKYWTYELVGGTLNLDSTYGLTALSICLVLGTGYVNGNLSLQNGLNSTNISLTIGQPINFSTINSIPIDSLEISTTGRILLIGIQ